MDRIALSLSKKRVEKLIVCLGYVNEWSTHAPQAVANRVADLLLKQCKPSPNDVHNPDFTHIRGRDAMGNPRMYYQAQTAILAHNSKHGQEPFRARHSITGRRLSSQLMLSSKKHSRRGADAFAASHAPQLWDSAPVPEYMGIWCDRLLLGDFQRPLRSALFIPHVPCSTSPTSSMFLSEAMERVGRSHRYLPLSDVLFVQATNNLPFGVIRQCNGLQLEQNQRSPTSNDKEMEIDVISTVSHNSAENDIPSSNTNNSRERHELSCALSFFAPSPTNELCSSLLIGVGTDTAMRGCFTTTREKQMNEILVPLATFACALWAANKEQSARYVESFTKGENTFSSLRANYRLWQTMQTSMLSTRDTNLLNAYFSKTPLDPRLSEKQTVYLAETLLRRLQESDTAMSESGKDN